MKPRGRRNKLKAISHLQKVAVFTAQLFCSNGTTGLNFSVRLKHLTFIFLNRKRFYLKNNQCKLILNKVTKQKVKKFFRFNVYFWFLQI